MKNLNLLKKNKSIKELLEFSILNIDKPAGPASFQVSDIIRKWLNLRKASYFGTLDPKVTGVLPLALNKACRLTRYFIRKKKTYVGIMKLHQAVSFEKLKQEMKEFLGEIQQLPPVKSRVKRQIRPRTIYKFDILEKQGKDVLFEAEVEAGTYIRKLVHDLGLKISGAHIYELRRTKAGIFSENDKEFANLYELKKAIEDFKKGKEEGLRKMLIPGEIIGKILPVVKVKKENLKNLLNGSPLFEDFIEGKIEIFEGKIAVFCNEKFVGVYNVDIIGKVIAKPEFVFKS